MSASESQSIIATSRPSKYGSTNSNKSAGSAATLNANSYFIHKLSKSDTLNGLAVKYSVQIADLKKLNALWNNDDIVYMEQLKVPRNAANKQQQQKQRGALRASRSVQQELSSASKKQQRRQRHERADSEELREYELNERDEKEIKQAKELEEEEEEKEVNEEEEGEGDNNNSNYIQDAQEFLKKMDFAIGKAKTFFDAKSEMAASASSTMMTQSLKVVTPGRISLEGSGGAAATDEEGAGKKTRYLKASTFKNEMDEPTAKKTPKSTKKKAAAVVTSSTASATASSSNAFQNSRMNGAATPSQLTAGNLPSHSVASPAASSLAVSSSSAATVGPATSASKLRVKVQKNNFFASNSDDLFEL